MTHTPDQAPGSSTQDTSTRTSRGGAGGPQPPAQVLLEVLQATPDLVAITDGKGSLLWINPAGRELLGLGQRRPIEELDLTALYAPDALPHVLDTIEPAMEDQGFWRGRTRLQTSQAEEVPVEATFVAHRDEEGEVSHHTAVMRDLRGRDAARGAMAHFWEVTPHLLATASPDARFLDLNPAWEETLGWQRSELTAKPFLSFVHPDDRAATQEAMAALREGETVRGFENRYETGDGVYRWLRWTATMGEELEVIYATAEDVTEPRRTEAERARHRERLAHLVDVQQEVTTAGLDLEESMATLAEAAEELTGADGAVVELAEGDEMVYRAATGMAEEHVGLRLDVASSLSGTSYQARELIVCPDALGDPRVDSEAVEKLGICSMILVPLVDEEVCHGVLKVVHREPDAFEDEDVEMLQLTSALLSAALTRSLVFEALDASETRFRQIAENLDTVLWINKPDFSQVLYVNPAYERVWGRPASEHEEDPVAWLDAVHEDDIAETVAELLAWDPHGNPLSLSFRILRPSGEIRHIEAEGFPVQGPDGQMAKVVGLAKDVTEVKDLHDEELEEARQRARAEELEQLLHISSHQLRTPIRQINSFGQMLEAELGGSLTKDQAELLGYIRQGAMDLQAMVQDLVTYAEVTGHRAPVRATSAQLAMDRALDGLADRIDATGASISRDALPEVEVNPWQLRHLFEELIENALVFNQGAPQVHVSAERAGGDRWLFSVEDDGIGFEPRHAARVTRMFERLNPPGEYEGVGMGLAICRRIVESHGGRLTIDTAPDQGTTVWFTLPAADPGASAPTADIPNIFGEEL